MSSRDPLPTWPLDYEVPERKAGGFSPSLQDPPLQQVLLNLHGLGREPFFAWWRMLCGCIVMNASNRRSVDLVWPHFFVLAPTPSWLLAVEEGTATDFDASGRTRVEYVLRKSGCQARKAEQLVRMTRRWVEVGPQGIDALAADDVADFPGCGRYAVESWRVFVESDFDVPCSDPVVEAWRILMRAEVQKLLT